MEQIPIVKPLRLFWAGRISKDKNVQTLIRALALCPPWYFLTIAGVGPAEKHIIRLAKELGVYDRLSFVGKLDPEGMDFHYSLCDVYCQPSYVLDACPRTVLEALSYGKPCFISDRCGRLHNEKVIPAFDYKKWAEELMKFNKEHKRIRYIHPTKIDLVEKSLKKTLSNRFTELLFGSDGSNYI